MLFRTSADLVYDDSIPEVVRKIACANLVTFVLRVLGGGRAFGKNLQFVLDSPEGSETD